MSHDEDGTIRPEPEDIAEVEMQFDSPAESDEEIGPRYRLAQAHALLRLFGYEKEPGTNKFRRARGT